MDEHLNAAMLKEWLYYTVRKDPDWLAGEIGTSVRLIFSMFNGAVPSRTVVMVKLARVMGVKVEDLLVPAKQSA